MQFVLELLVGLALDYSCNNWELLVEQVASFRKTALLLDENTYIAGSTAYIGIDNNFDSSPEECLLLGRFE